MMSDQNQDRLMKSSTDWRMSTPSNISAYPPLTALAKDVPSYFHDHLSLSNVMLISIIKFVDDTHITSVYTSDSALQLLHNSNRITYLVSHQSKRKS